MDNNGHGSYVNQLIQNVSESKCSITNYCFLNKELRGKSRDLLIMLENIPLDTDIINLSLSTSMIDYAEDLERVCKKLVQKNITIIASISNKTEPSYPADFPCVLGIKGYFLNNSKKIRYEINKKMNIIADKSPVVVRDIDGKFNFFGGNSKSTAYVSGVLAQKIRKEGFSLNGYLAEIGEVNEEDLYDIYSFEYGPRAKDYDAFKLKMIELILEDTFEMKYKDYENLRIENVFTNGSKTLTKLLHSLMAEFNFDMDKKLIRIIDFKNAYSIYDAFNL
ncbi:hypothetical protein [Paenibacillus faecalis]|uniref:hypothetical protein n=1 Tax=Paenibacillus faecalis TaxID=2079532 RepID=UPI000D0E87C3|nr:hypothetical protein [Paenibacillus faecalis]